MTIEILVLDIDQFVISQREFETIKEARAWVKQTGLRADYWDYAAEVPNYAADNIHAIQLLVDGEVRQDWTPDFAV